jgi:hypothetical protein
MLHKSCIRLAVCQVVFTDVLIVGHLDVYGQSFAPIGLHKTGTVSAHKMALHWYERLAGGPVTKFVG